MIRRRGCGRSSPGTPGTGRRGWRPRGTAGCRRPSSRSSSRSTTRSPSTRIPTRASPPGRTTRCWAGCTCRPRWSATRAAGPGCSSALTPLGARTLLGLPAGELASWTGRRRRYVRRLVNRSSLFLPPRTGQAGTGQVKWAAQESAPPICFARRILKVNGS